MKHHILLGLCLWLTIGIEAGRSREPSPAAGGAHPHLVFVIGENEYHTWETLPEFARRELPGVHCSFVNASPMPGGMVFTNFEVIRDADLLVFSVRRRTPPVAMLELIHAHVNAGKPVVGIRTATHAFDAKPSDEDHGAWPTFDRDVFGASYQNHYNNTGSNAPPTLIRVIPEAAAQPILTGFPTNEIRVTSSLYKSRDLATTAIPLLTGQVEGRPEIEPVAWINTGNHSRVFYTSLGSPEDFRQPFFRRLLRNGIWWTLGEPIPGEPGK